MDPMCPSKVRSRLPSAACHSLNGVIRGSTIRRLPEYHTRLDDTMTSRVLSPNARLWLYIVLSRDDPYLETPPSRTLTYLRDPIHPQKTMSIDVQPLWHIMVYYLGLYGHGIRPARRPSAQQKKHRGDISSLGTQQRKNKVQKMGPTMCQKQLKYVF